MKQTQYTHRLIARITIEAKSPLAIGTGTKNILTDAPVAVDVNGLPYIPSTTLAGILRHALENSKENSSSIYGFQSENDGHGSEIVFTDAIMIGADGNPKDGLLSSEDLKDPFYDHYKEMPIRQHVRINEYGTTDKGGKFDNQVTYKGTRFLFEIELYYNGTTTKEEQFLETLRQLRNKGLRVGGGTRKGYGEIEIVECKTRSLDLNKGTDLECYLNKSSKLTDELPGMENFSEESQNNTWNEYQLTLRPDDFFLFGSGLGDDEADMTPVTEAVVEWDDNGKPKFQEKQVLIPASSVKGALAHRTAFHWNKLNNYFAGSEEAKVGDKNPAVKAIFGCSSEEITRGKILISDVFKNALPDKVINHVAIDRFTGGAIEGALFNEKTIYGEQQPLTLTIQVEKDALKDDTVRSAFEQTLKDICTGMLPLGGGVNRGNGIFNGKVTKNGTEL